MKPLRAQLADDERELNQLTARLAELRKTYNTIIDMIIQTGRGLSTITNPVGPELERLESDVKSQQSRIQSDKGAIVDLEEEARRAGAPPRWLRQQSHSRP